MVGINKSVCLHCKDLLNILFIWIESSLTRFTLGSSPASSHSGRFHQSLIPKQLLEVNHMLLTVLSCTHTQCDFKGQTDMLDVLTLALLLSEKHIKLHHHLLRFSDIPSINYEYYHNLVYS